MSEAKKLVAQKAVSLVKPGMVVGLGSGSTASLFIAALGEAVRSGAIRDIVGIPTSRDSETLAKQAGIAVTDFADKAACDLTIDGADEVTDSVDLIKGLGGAMLREKLVAQNSKRLVIIVDDSKRVSRLGTKSPLPVEVTPFGLAAHERFMRSLGAEPILRRKKDSDEPYVTDNGNLILDCRFANGMKDAATIERALGQRAGIVEHGLFLGIARGALIATKAGTVETLGDV